MRRFSSHQTQPPTIEETGFWKAPKRSSSSSWGKWLRSAIWFLNGLLGASAVVLGIHDLLLSPRAAERATGAVFFVGGGLLLASAITVLTSDSDKARDFALAGFILGLSPGAALAFIQFGGYGYSHRVFGWLLAVAIPAVGAVMVWQAGARFRPFLATSSIALLAAGITLLPPLLGGAFRPVVDASLVDAQVDMKVVGRRHDAKLGDVAVVDTKLTIKNIGKRRLVFVGSLYSVRAVDSEHRVSPSEDLPWPMDSELNKQSWSARFESPWIYTVTEVGYDFLATGDILEPGQHHVETVLTLVPSDKYDTAEVYATVATAFDDRLRLGEKNLELERRTLTSKTPVESTWDIEPSSWAVWLTHGPQDLKVKYAMDFIDSRFAGLYLEFGAGREHHKQRILEEYNPRIITTYGLGYTTAYRSIMLDAAGT